MGVADRAKNNLQDAKGKAKEAVGDVTDNDDLKAKGKSDQSKSKAKNAGEDLKDAGSKAKDAVTR